MIFLFSFHHFNSLSSLSALKDIKKRRRGFASTLKKTFTIVLLLDSTEGISVFLLGVSGIRVNTATDFLLLYESKFILQTFTVHLFLCLADVVVVALEQKEKRRNENN